MYNKLWTNDPPSTRLNMARTHYNRNVGDQEMSFMVKPNNDITL